MPITQSPRLAVIVLAGDAGDDPAARGLSAARVACRGRLASPPSPDASSPPASALRSEARGSRGGLDPGGPSMESWMRLVGISTPSTHASTVCPTATSAATSDTYSV